MLLHWSVGWVAASHAAELEDALGVVSRAEGHAIGILAHLDTGVEEEEAKVTHVEDLFHLRLECLHFSFLYTSDDEVIDVDGKEQDSARCPVGTSPPRARFAGSPPP
jgi:hypothetical protein